MHKGTLLLGSVSELSDAAAESLSKHEGSLSLDGLTKLGKAGAKYLAKMDPEDLELPGEYSDGDEAVTELVIKYR